MEDKEVFFPYPLTVRNQTRQPGGELFPEIYGVTWSFEESNTEAQRPGYLEREANAPTYNASWKSAPP